jgi:hypothetical protein
MHRESSDMHLACGGKHVSDEKANECGLSCPRWSNEEGELSTLNGEADISEGNMATRVLHGDSL